MEGCTELCWKAVPCPECGQSMPPAGRSAPLGSQCWCSSKYQHTKENTRHLWNKHDSNRAYTDKEGWEKHVSECQKCKEEE